jgi:hypothetical protein
MNENARFVAAVALTLGFTLGAPGLAADGPIAPAVDLPGGRSASGQVGDAGPPAPKPVPAEILVLHATNSGGGIDPELRHLKQLQKPPFSSYDTYRLIRRHEGNLEMRQPNATRLPNGRVLRTALKEVVPPDRYRVATSISRPGSKEGSGDGGYLPLLEVTAKSGETFFVAGQSFRGGILVVGIRVGEESKPPDKAPDKAPPKR